MSDVLPAPKPHAAPVGWVGRILGAVLEGTLRRLPRGVRVGLARAVAAAAYGLGIRRRITLDNLRQALPELTEARRREIARGAYRNMALAALESVCAGDLTPVALETAVVTDGWAPIEEALRAGKGLLVATAHFGSWEFFAEVMSRRGVPVHAVVRPLRGAFNARLVESRQRQGVSLIAPKGAIAGTVRALRKGGAVAMLIDQVLPADRGVFVPFFQRPACTTPALSAAALRTGAPVFVVMAAREGDHLRMFVEGPFPVPHTEDRHADLIAHTAQVTAVIERYIRAYPDQWLWLHRRWKVQPPHDEAAPTPVLE